MKLLPTILAGLLLVAQSHATVWISEFVADNDGSYLDEDGKDEDWIELHNDGASAVDLSGWHLTDDSSDLTQWTFPHGSSIAASGYLVVFASGNNRRFVGEPFHTNFKLKASGEYLALVRPDGTTIEHHYSATYPPQFEGVSFGLDQTEGTSTAVTTGASGQVGVPTSQADFNANYVNWNSDKTGVFSGSWQSATTGVGYEQNAGYGIWLGTDVESEMYGNNASLFLRVPFQVPNASAVDSVALRMRWDDGMEAFINGVRVATDRAPSSPTWNSTATGYRSDNQNDDWHTVLIDPATVGLVNGVNILAIQGLNENINSSDMLVLPELDLIIPGSTSSTQAYQNPPSPGSPNTVGTMDVPPLLTNVTEQVTRPTGGAGSAPVLIEAEISETVDDIDEVRLYHRVMFGAESQLTMRDDGLGGDLVSGDDIYSALMPTTGLNPGEMIRWRVEAEDDNSRIAQSPRYDDPLDADRYYGTVATNSAHSTAGLSILETFVEDEPAANTRGGTRTSVYYLGEFYDNVQMDLHGQSTAGASFPKKSYDVDFNRGSRFRWKAGEDRVKDINLLTNYADKSKVRNAMAYEFLNRCGTAYHFAFPVRVERNGEFFSVVDMVEDGDDRYLNRIGLDDNGALYKMYDRMEDADEASKKTRQDEGNDDLAALIAGLDPINSEDDRRKFAYDNLDLAATVNYIAAYIVAGITDTGHKNYYMYRDSEGDGEWRPLPWDVDLSAGRRWNSTDRYFDDTLFWTRWTFTNNRMLDLVTHAPDYQLMLLRRINTLREQILGAPGTPAAGDWYVQSIEDMKDLIDPTGITSDADLDYTEWGSWGNNNRMRPAADRIVTEWLPNKRDYIFSSSRKIDGISVPGTQPASPDVTIETVEFLPVSGNQDEEYLVIKNRESEAIDLSGWTLSGAIEYTFPPGTVIPAGNGNAAAKYVGVLHVARRAEAFRARSGAVTGNQFRFVQGGYEGQLSARGETIHLHTDLGVLADSKTYAGAPTAAQLRLRVSELNYHPTDPTPSELSSVPGVIADDFEYVELINIGTASLDLEGCQFTEGIDYTFGSGVTLAVGERIILCKNLAAFTARYGSISATVVGPYIGQLSNDGESIRLVDSQGENVLTFSYNDRWFPPADGIGRSMVLRDTTTAYNGLDVATVWAISGSESGSPGTADTDMLSHFNAWQEGHFTALEWADPLKGDPLADPDLDGNLNWQEYAFGLDPNVADKRSFRGLVTTDEGSQYLAATTRRTKDAFDLTWTLETGTTLTSLSPTTGHVVSTVDHGDGTETVIIRDTTTVGSTTRKFLRLRLGSDY